MSQQEGRQSMKTRLIEMLLSGLINEIHQPEPKFSSNNLEMTGIEIITGGAKAQYNHRQKLTYKLLLEIRI